MAQKKIYNNSNFLTSPPSIHGPEVSADWKRTTKGEVRVTLNLPRDTVDSEIYIKTPRGHSGILMDPWASSTWRKSWDKDHTPNRVTKEKLKIFRQQRMHKSISLHQTVGRNRCDRKTFWSPRPNKPHNPRAFGLLCDTDHQDVFSRQEKLDQARSLAQQPSPRKRPRQESLSASLDDLPLVISSDKEDPDHIGVTHQANSEDNSQVDHIKGKEEESPLSPPDHEKGPQALAYEPKSPVDTPSKDSDSMPKLMTPPEEKPQGQATSE